MHDAEFEHDHEKLLADSVEVEGLEKLTLASVGIDIGSSTSQVLFSRLTLRRQENQRTGEYVVARREVLWRSPILLTPYASPTRIDFEAVRGFIEGCYRAAGFGEEGVDTGAVVITGEALRKENAQPIVEYFSQAAGKFICASAGPHHEALLAAYGSGAVQISKAGGGRVLNLDVGGGTTKLALIDKGVVVATAAINIGARLVAFDDSGRVTRVEEAGRAIAADAGVPVRLDSILNPAERAFVARRMLTRLTDLLEHGAGAAAQTQALMLTPPPPGYHGLSDVDHVTVSGGVSEYVYGRTAEAFGDLGAELGAGLRGFLDRLPAGVALEPGEGVRATVIGASEHTVQVSGATSFFTSTAPLPVKGYKVVAVRHRIGEDFRAALRNAFSRYDLEGFGPGLVLSLSLEGEIAYPSLREVAAGLVEAVAGRPDTPAIVTVEQDVARSLGHLMKTELKAPNELVCIDGVAVGELDYIDVGLPLTALDLFPVTVKSLLFSGAGAGHGHDRHHDHHHHHGHGRGHHHHDHDHGHDHGHGRHRH